MNLLEQYLNVNSVLLLFIVIFAFIVIRQLIIGLSKSHFKNVVLAITFIIAIISFYARQLLIGFIFLLLGLILLIGLHYIGEKHNENKE